MIDIPSLPGNFNELGPEQKDQNMSHNTLVSRTKYYEISCLS